MNPQQRAITVMEALLAVPDKDCRAEWIRLLDGVFGCIRMEMVDAANIVVDDMFTSLKKNATPTELLTAEVILEELMTRLRAIPAQIGTAPTGGKADP